ncbi:MAG: hypothetical protein V1729_03525 [Candidatus Woesearchaeota archaeon]
MASLKDLSDTGLYGSVCTRSMPSIPIPPTPMLSELKPVSIDAVCDEAVGASDVPVLEDGFDMVAEGDRIVLFDEEIIIEIVNPTDESLSGYECRVCGVPHDVYLREGAGIEERWKNGFLRLNSTLEDEVVQCEQGFMMTRLSLLDYNASKEEGRINDAHLYCPTCETVHEGEYKVVSQGHNCRDTNVMCPGGRIMPRHIILEYSRRKIREDIDKNTRTVVVREKD